MSESDRMVDARKQEPGNDSPAKQPEQPPPKANPPKTTPPKTEPPKIGPPPKVESLTPEVIKPDPESPNQPFEVDPSAKAAGKTLYLSVLTPFAYKAGPWKLGIGGRGDNPKSPILVQKKEYKYGISMHPPQTEQGSCLVSFVPSGEFKKFKGWAAINDGQDPWGQVLFSVWGDGKKLWESQPLTKANTAVGFDIDVTGVKVLTLDTRMKEGHHHTANAVWLDPWLER